jgi:GT2 family glycosyltransferase
VIKTAIVILNWNTRNHLETFLPFLVQYSSAPDVEVVLADNASTDDSVDFVRKNYPEIRVIQLDRNYGFAEGYNRALKQVDAEYYIILNSDIEVSPGWVAPLIDLLEKNPEIGACAPKLLSYYDHSKFEYAGAAGGFIDYLGYPFCRGRVFDYLETDHGQYDGNTQVFWATGACIVVRSELFHRLGGFDAYYFAHQEEIDLCWRLQLAGYKIYCTSQSVVYHLGGGTLPKSNPHKTFLNFRNNHVLLYKNLPTFKWLLILLPRLILDGVAAFKFLAGQKPSEFWSVVKAHFCFYGYVFSHLNLVWKKTQTRKVQLFSKSIVIQHYLKKKITFAQLSE